MRRRILAGALLAILGTGALFCAITLRRGRKTSAVFPNGVRVTVEGITFGSNHVFTTDSAIVQTLRHILPAGLQQSLPKGYEREEHTVADEALVYLSAFDPTSRRYLSSTTWGRFLVLDEHGCVWPVNSLSGDYGAPAFCVSTVYLSAFPRRASSFILRAYMTGGPFVDLHVRNPVKGPFPKWTAEPLPARRTVGDLTFELRDIRARWSTNVPNSFTPSYAVFRNGADVTQEWRPIKNLRDATGNRAEVLSPYEDVWKVELKFLKTAKGSFSPGQIWRIPSVSVPEDGRTRVFNQSHSLSNIQVHLVALTGSGDFKFSNGIVVASSPWRAGMSSGESSSSSGSGGTIIGFVTKEPVLLASMVGLSSADDLLIRYRDATARVGEGVLRSEFEKQYRYVLPDLKPGSSVDLELIRQEPITVEFSIRPPSPPAIVTKP